MRSKSPTDAGPAAVVKEGGRMLGNDGVREELGYRDASVYKILYGEEDTSRGQIPKRDVWPKSMGDI